MFALKNTNKLCYLAIILLISGCTNSITFKDDEGNKLYFKKENISCDYNAVSNERGIEGYFKGFCDANGVSTDLAGRRKAISISGWCNNHHLEGDIRMNEMACKAALKFKILKEPTDY